MANLDNEHGPAHDSLTDCSSNEARNSPLESPHEQMNPAPGRVATGFDCEPLPNGNVLVEFFGEDGKTMMRQEVSPAVIENMPVVASLTLVAMKKGLKAINEICRHSGTS